MKVTQNIAELPSLGQAPYVVGMPTETVYGLAARIDSPLGIAAIFKIKERPFFDPLIVHVADLAQARSLTTQWSPVAQALATAFWPGPLTLVLPKADHVDPMITSGLGTVGIRIPRHSMALALIKKEGPLAAPSANKFGKTSPTEASHVVEEFQGQVPVLDGGPCQIGLESTILSIEEVAGVHQLRILRLGHISQDQITRALSYGGRTDFKWSILRDGNKTIAPGQMKHHYMPNVPLVILQDTNLSIKDLKNSILEKLSQLPAEVEGIKLKRPQSLDKVVEIVLPADAELAARLLYSELRKSAEQLPDLMYFKVQEYHHLDNWAAIFDRLTRAASLIV